MQRQFGDLVQLKTVSGDPVKHLDYTLTPQCRTFSIRTPFGGIVWNRPVAVLVECEGETMRVPILDWTRITQLGIFSFGLFVSLAVWIGSRREKES